MSDTVPGGTPPEPEPPSPAEKIGSPSGESSSVTDRSKRVFDWLDARIGFSDEAEKSLVRVGCFVFVTAAVLGLVTLTSFTIGSFIGSLIGIELLDWRFLRAMELFLMTASVGIVVAILTSSPSGWVTTVGVLLIAALIVPTRDMVQFALLMTDKEDAFSVLFPDEFGAVEYSGQNEQLARNIYLSLAADTDTKSEMGVLLGNDDGFRDRFIVAVREAIDKEQVNTLNERMQIRGVTEILTTLYNQDTEGTRSDGGSPADAATEVKAVGNGEAFKSYAYRYGREPDFLKDMAYLRSLRLVEFSYDNIRDARISDLGIRVIETNRNRQSDAAPVGQGDDSRTLRLRREGFTFVAENATEILEVCDAAATAPTAYSGPLLERTVEAAPLFAPGQKYTGYAFSVGAQANLRVSLAAGLSDADPILLVFTVGNGECGTYSLNDDAQRNTGELSSEISGLFAAGAYVAVAGDLRESGQPMTLTIAVVDMTASATPSDADITSSNANITPSAQRWAARGGR